MMEQSVRNNSCNSVNMDNNNYITNERSVEDITNQMNCMNVDMISQMVLDSSNECKPSELITTQETGALMEDSILITRSPQEDSRVHSSIRDAPKMMDMGGFNNSIREPKSSNSLIVTNVDSSVFYDPITRQKFEALFLAYHHNVTFRYLKSFRRVRIDFTNTNAADRARTNLDRNKLGNTEFRCFAAQIIRPNSNFNLQNNTNGMDEEVDSDNQIFTSSTYLNIPKLTKQFLISPPASPPVGWEPVSENSPSIDVQLISAIANLVPGQVHEIHPASDSQPAIFVEVCENPQFETSRKSCSRSIPRTMSPSYCK